MMLKIYNIEEHGWLNNSYNTQHMWLTTINDHVFSTRFKNIYQSTNRILKEFRHSSMVKLHKVWSPYQTMKSSQNSPYQTLKSIEFFDVLGHHIKDIKGTTNNTLDP